MSDHTQDNGAPQEDLVETEEARSLLDKLLTDSRLYTKSKDYKELTNLPKVRGCESFL